MNLIRVTSNIRPHELGWCINPISLVLQRLSVYQSICAHILNIANFLKSGLLATAGLLWILLDLPEHHYEKNMFLCLFGCGRGKGLWRRIVDVALILYWLLLNRQLSIFAENKKITYFHFSGCNHFIFELIWIVSCEQDM